MKFVASRGHQSIIAQKDYRSSERIQTACDTLLPPTASGRIQDSVVIPEANVESALQVRTFLHEF